MTFHLYNIFIIFTIHLTLIFYTNHGFEVMQPQQQTVNPDRSASISCEHTANVSSVEDVRLNSISLTGKSSTLCQKGMDDCKNIIMHQENPTKYIFIILNIRPEAMNLTYECEVTMKEKDLDYTEKGTPTRLLQGQQETVEQCSTPPSLPPACHHLLRWILIGLLALMFLYSCVITSFCIRLTRSNSDGENSTYVEMRQAPLPRNRPSDIYCG